jgi:hypothetical protein
MTAITSDALPDEDRIQSSLQFALHVRVPTHVSDEELQQTIRLLLRLNLILWTGIFIDERPVFAEAGSGTLLVPDNARILIDAGTVAEDWPGWNEWEGDLAPLMFLLDELLHEDHACNIFSDKPEAFRTGFQLGRATQDWTVNLGC